MVVLCLSFLLMIGFSLVAEGFGFHIPKGYLYAAIGFSVLIEFFNQLAQRSAQRHESRQPLRERTTAAIFKLMGAAGPTSTRSRMRRRSWRPPPHQLRRGGALHGDRGAVARRALHPHHHDPRAEMEWIDVNDSPDEIRALLQRAPHSLFPVCDGELDEIIGVVKARDLLFSLNEGSPWPSSPGRMTPS